MLRTVCNRLTLWEALLPPEALVMLAELEAVDRLLDDPALLEPFRRWFDPVVGRPSIPIESNSSTRDPWLARVTRATQGISDRVSHTRATRRRLRVGTDALGPRRCDH